MSFNGLRTQKTVDGVLHEYEYSGGRLYYEKYGDYQYFFRYNALGNLATIKRRSISGNNEKSLYVICNSRGDVEELRNTDGTLYARYVYDSWGNTIKILDANGNPITAATNIAVQNPLRYRGYYWDSETGLYYLNTIYYDPIVGRFINADDVEVALASPDALTDKNLYAYCDNNPVTRTDSGGGCWHIAVGAVVGFTTSFVSTLAVNAAFNEYATKEKLFLSALVSGVIGAVSGGAIAAVPHCAVAINTAAGVVDSVLGDIISGEKEAGKIVTNAVVSAGFSAVTGSWGSDFSGKGAKIVNEGADSTKNIVSSSFKKIKSMIKRETPKAKIKGNDVFYTTKATKYVAKSYSIGQLADTALSFVKKGVQEIGNMFLKALFGR